MATYIMFGKYSQTALKGISPQRTKKVANLVKKCKGSIKEIYALLGGQDLLVIADFPGTKEAMKASLSLSKLTGISFATAPAVTVQEFDKLAAGA